MITNKSEGVSTALELACQFFAANPDEELYVAVKDATAKKLDSFLEMYHEFANASRLKTPVLQPGMLRPYLQTDQFGSRADAWLRGAFDLGVQALEDESAVWKVVDEIKHRLLYCHSVAVDDPFGIIVALARNDNLHPADVARNKGRLLNYVNLLIHLRPLIERHILCFMAPEYYDKGDEHPAPLKYLFNGFSNQSAVLPTPDIREFINRAPQGTRNHWDKLRQLERGEELILDTLRSVAVDRIYDTFSGLSSAPGRISPYFPFRYDIELISVFQDQMRLAAAGAASDTKNLGLLDVPDRDNRLLTELVKLDLPGLASLSPDDIVSIRQGDVFEEWRDTLKTGLQRASELDPKLLDLDKAARAVVTEAVQPAYRKLQKEFKSSSFLGQVGSASTTLVCGGIGGIAGYLVEPSMGGLVGALTGSFAEAAAELFKKWAKARGEMPAEIQAATRSHYVALLG
jgi:hypothetical protein